MFGKLSGNTPEFFFSKRDCFFFGGGYLSVLTKTFFFFKFNIKPGGKSVKKSFKL